MSEIIKLDNIDLSSVVEGLKKGKTVVYPTETCYGLGCDASNQDSVDKVFKIKQRQLDKPLLMIVPDEKMAMEYIEWNEKIAGLCQKYLPGPLTIVARAIEGRGLAKGVLAEDGTAAFRIIDHPFASELTDKFGKPLVSTSANISSHESPYSMESVVEMFENQEYQPDIIIDAGELLSKNLSTVVKVEDGRIEVLRQGGLVVEV